jgi:hypothetical protein
MRQGHADTALVFAASRAHVEVVVPLIGLDAVAFPLGKRLVVSRHACEFEVRLGLTLQKGLEDVVGDEHERHSSPKCSSKARPRREHNASERLQHDHTLAERAIKVRQQTRHDVR